MKRLLPVFAAVVTMFAGSGALGVVNTIDATVTAEVREFFGGERVNSDLAFEDLTQTTPTLPLVADVHLSRQDSGGTDIAGGAATSRFSDPRLSVLPDPDEFALDAVAFSTDPSISYQGTAGSTETREIVFTAEEIGQADGTGLQAQSFFFVDGTIVLWSETPGGGLGSTSAELILSVTQTRAGAEPQTVLTAGLILQGQADGSVELNTDGAIDADNVQLVDMGEGVPELGPAHVLIIPNIAIPYTYAADVGEVFTLTASIETRINTGPQTGASVVLGLPVLELAALLNTLTGGQAGTALQELIESASAKAPPPARSLVASSGGTTVTLAQDGMVQAPWPFGACGAVGAETALLGVAFATIGYACRRTRGHRAC